MANSYLNRTTGSPSNADKVTISAWIKRTPGAEQVIIGEYGSSSNRSKLQFKSNDKLEYYQVDGGSATVQIRTNRVFRDASAFYHIVMQYDSAQSTASDRLKLYINGTQETSLAISTYPPQNQDTRLNKSGVNLHIGQDGNSGNYFEGYISHIALVDNAISAPTVFGETDSTSGIWKFKSPSATWGNNGFHLKFENSGNIGLDSSGEGNNFTVSTGTAVQVLDTPSNVTCTLNPLAIGSSAPTFSIGATRVVATATSYQFSCGTFAIPLYGKWYWEVKADNNVNGSNSEYLIGAVLESRLQASSNFAEFASDGITQYGSVSPNIGANDIISVAVDRTAATLKIYKNDSLILTKTSLPTELIFPMVTVFGSGVNAYSNFGNGYFGTTAVSSPGTNASNLGIFEYDVPTGYTALCTKGLNE